MWRIADKLAAALHRIYYQLFCGEEFFVHKLPFDRSSLTAGVSGWARRNSSP